LLFGAALLVGSHQLTHIFAGTAVTAFADLFLDIVLYEIG
jgi:hypothetical protein